jgi:hypothetical protein
MSEDGYGAEDVNYEGFDDPTLFAGRRCIAFLVDMSKSMFERDPSGEYHAKKALIQLRDFLNSIALSANMSDRVAVIFINVVC